MACALSSKASISGRVAGCRAPVAARARVLAPVRRHQLLARAEAGTVVAAEVTDASFEEDVLNSPIPVLVDFWAPWCGPCRMIAPIVDELAVEYSGKLKCVKLNTDESPGVATKYGIRSIPTVMIFKNGNKMDTVIGAVPKSTLIQTIDKYL